MLTETRQKSADTQTLDTILIPRRRLPPAAAASGRSCKIEATNVSPCVCVQLAEYLTLWLHAILPATDNLAHIGMHFQTDAHLKGHGYVGKLDSSKRYRNAPDIFSH